MRRRDLRLHALQLRLFACRVDVGVCGLEKWEGFEGHVRERLGVPPLVQEVLGDGDRRVAHGAFGDLLADLLGEHLAGDVLPARALISPVPLDVDDQSGFVVAYLLVLAVEGRNPSPGQFATPG